jgi:ABC-type dipeptide/oligopeptide/nickel transport system permease component
VSVIAILRRITAALLFVALVSTAALVLARQAPGDYTDMLRAARMPADAIARERSRLHLDRSLPGLAAVWLSGLPRLDLRESFRFSRPVTDLIAERAPRTLALAGTAIFLALACGVWWGTCLVSGPLLIRRALSALAALALSLPAIVILFFLIFAAVSSGWLGHRTEGAVIPALGILSLVVPASGAIARLHADALMQALDEPWATASLARGVTRRVLVWKLGMRVAATRVISIMPLVSANVFGASLLVEMVTGWAGLGRLMFDARVARDIFLVAGCTAALTAAVVALGLLADALTAALDPRMEAPR